MALKHIKKVNGKVLLTEQRAEDRTQNSSLWSSHVAASGIAKGAAGRAAGSVGFEALQAKGQRGSKLCQSCLN